ncbi:MAG: ribonuclease III [Burkholderiales bacterium]
MNLDPLFDRLGYRFRIEDLLRQALTHRSHGSPHNERLEFLGDSALNCAVASLLFERSPDASEGDMSRMRAHLVREQTLFDIARTLQLGDHIVLGEGERKSGGAAKPSLLADTLEAVFGAVYVDGGFEHLMQVVTRLYTPFLRSLACNAVEKDPKTLLQELLQSRKLPLPSYTVVATLGEPHNRRFKVECRIEDPDIRSTGEGQSRRGAEQSAAQQAYRIMLGQ